MDEAKYIKNRKDFGYFTVGRLKKFLNDNKSLSDDSLILIQRVEDRYYEKHGWSTIKRKDYMGETNEYSPAWGVFCEETLLFIDLHY